jgi:hypothetical protein
MREMLRGWTAFTRSGGPIEVFRVVNSIFIGAEQFPFNPVELFLDDGLCQFRPMVVDLGLILRSPRMAL